jgi:DNA mismatch repair protein MutS2
LDKYLDDAALAGLTQVRIVHGKGTGALREAVHNYLREHPGVTDFAQPPHEEGGHGVTIAELKN